MQCSAKPSNSGKRPSGTKSVTIFLRSTARKAPGHHRKTTTGHIGRLSLQFSPMETQAETHSKHKPIQIHFEEVFEPRKTSPDVRLWGLPNTFSPGMGGGFWMSRVKTGVESDDFDMFSSFFLTVAFSGRFLGNRQQTLGNFTRNPAWIYWSFIWNSEAWGFQFSISQCVN